jgi:hypothetical protein
MVQVDGNQYPNAFIFSLTNRDNKPIKIKVDPDYHDHAICCDTKYGPIFGYGPDILIGNKASDGYSNLGYSYSQPQYEFKTYEAETFLAGTENFQSDNIEVYKKAEK